MILIAADIGLKRIGLAMWVQGVILPLEPILRHNRQQASQQLQMLLELKKPDALIVGLPDAHYATTRKRILHFVGLLDFAPIVYVNESSSSELALEGIAHLSHKQRQQARKNGMLDSLAACEILKRYVACTPSILL